MQLNEPCRLNGNEYVCMQQTDQQMTRYVNFLYGVGGEFLPTHKSSLAASNLATVVTFSDFRHVQLLLREYHLFVGLT